MNETAALDSILARFLDDRDSLTDPEFHRLLETLRSDSQLAGRLKDHLLMEELLAQQFAESRSVFIAQVERRLRAESEATAKRSSGDSAETYALRRPEQALFNGNGHSAPTARAQKSDPAPPAPDPNAPPMESAGHPWLIFFAVLGGVFLLAGGLLRLEYTEAARKIGEVDEAQGMALIYRGEVGTVAAPGMAILPGDEIRIPADAELTLTFRDRSRLRLASNSRAVLQPGTGRLPGLLTGELPKTIFLHEGRLEATVVQQKPGKPLIVETPRLQVEAPDARLIVTRDDEQSRVEVVEGRVSVDAKHDDEPLVEVAAGYQVIASADAFEVSPGDWPVNREGAVFLLSPRAAISRTPEEGVRLFAAGPNDSSAILRPRRAADFAGGGMKFQGGAFLADDEAASAVISRCRDTGAITIGLMFQTTDLAQTGPARWVTLSSNTDDYNIALVQEGDQCLLRLLTTGPSQDPARHEIPLFVIPDDRPHHLAVTFGEERLRCYLDGRELPLAAEVQGTFADWSAGHLLFGDEWTGGGEWTGTLWGVAIYDRALSAEEIARNILHFQLRFSPGASFIETEE